MRIRIQNTSELKRCNCLKSIKEKNRRMRILLTTDNVCIFIRYYKKVRTLKHADSKKFQLIIFKLYLSTYCNCEMVSEPKMQNDVCKTRCVYSCIIEETRAIYNKRYCMTFLQKVLRSCISVMQLTYTKTYCYRCNGAGIYIYVYIYIYIYILRVFVCNN